MPVLARRFALVLVGLISFAPLSAVAEGPRVTGLEYRGRATLPQGMPFAGTVVGGLSGWAFEAGSGTLWAISDDRGEVPQRGPVRLYRLEVDLADGRLDEGDVKVREVLPLSGASGGPLPAKEIDPEGIALLDGGFLISSEGVADRGVAPFVALLASDGRWASDLPLPERLRPAPGRGVRQNLALESLALSPDARYLFTATENALVQDGPAADVGVGSPSRILRFDRQSGERAELVYPVSPLDGAPAAPDSFRVRGLVDLLPLSGDRLLALEREFAVGSGNRAVLYELSLAGATDVAGLDSLAAASFVPAEKSPLLDLSGLGIPLENFEGLAFGPAFPDGRRSLLVVSDDNFDAPRETTTVLAFAVDSEPFAVARVQGAAHRSPFEGWWLAGVPGVVTAVDGGGRDPGFFLESTTPDGDPATSEGLFVAWKGATALAVGQSVEVAGHVEEIAAGKALSVTRLVAATVKAVAEEKTLPPPARLPWGTAFPSRVDGDGLTRFDPREDAIDLWESLEGMRVELPAGEVVGPTASFGELVLRPDEAAPAARTAVGGVRLGEGGPNLERVVLGRRFLADMPTLDVGDRISGSGALVGALVGVVDYSFGNTKLLPLAPLQVERKGRACAETTVLSSDRPSDRRFDRRHLTLATFNVENLSAVAPEERFRRLGEVIAVRMGGPAVVALEEIQDDSGPAKGDGVVSAKVTLGRLTEAVAAAGGPHYRAVWIDPVLDREGGQPGGNIRVVLLVDPARVELVERGTGGPLDATEPVGKGRRLALSLSPGRVAPTSPAFDLREGEGVRRALAAELRFGGRTLFVVANHWSSKFDDDRLFGATQPPRTPTAAKRLAQAMEIRAFATKLLAADPKARIVVLGDLNDFEHAAAVRALAAPPLQNLLLRVSDADRYTFNFEGASQVLDHVVVSPALASGAEIDLVHLNADCADVRRTSDHDPVVVRLRVR